MNFITPGLGTILSAFLGRRGRRGRCGVICTGVGQGLSVLFLFGWIWALSWSIRLYRVHSRGEGIEPKCRTCSEMSLRSTIRAPKLQNTAGGFWDSDTSNCDTVRL